MVSAYNTPWVICTKYVLSNYFTTLGIVKANEIIVMDNGNIVASGTHEVLIKECDVYQKLYGSEWESYCNLIHYTSDDDIN